MATAKPDLVLSSMDLREFIAKYPTDLSIHQYTNGIQQDAFIYYCLSNTNKTLSYKPHEESRSVFIYVIEGQVIVNDKTLTKGDGYGLLECKNVDLNSLPDTELLLFDMGKN